MEIDSPVRGGNARKRQQNWERGRQQQNAGRQTRTMTPAFEPKNQYQIAPLILTADEFLNRTQLNKLLVAHLPQVKLSNIQQNKNKTFTLFPLGAAGFNKILNEFPVNQCANPQNVKVFLPKSTEKIQQIDKEAIIKHVDIEIPENEIAAELKHAGLSVISVYRFQNFTKSGPETTIKVTFSDIKDKETFIKVELSPPKLSVQLIRSDQVTASSMIMRESNTVHEEITQLDTSP
ncbi:unnamed protein product [Didymodactylos carnosus]|uniref:Uncharacterized protein n=1 Tax=Didymodactylos carnosus TaxID=1234261 RepID=A0A814LIM1_9BILA|nr:unnamed protein product [Didymodactylos carnosus]CAF1065218.1 unnamed protein product [Didymodactylos carnosus]CAF3816463.1 unnamed protein product [Didymodactylos carnosus]CAF3832992.1 unnamed protein product [Didymodactylos carnosus]